MTDKAMTDLEPKKELIGKDSKPPALFSAHQEACINIYLAASRARGVNYSNQNPAAIEAGLTWSKFLQDIPADQLNVVFQCAMKNYYGNENTPFGVPQLRAAYAEIQEMKVCDIPASVQAIQEMSRCNHNYAFIDEPDSPIFQGFYICQHCKHAKPSMKKIPPGVQNYLKNIPYAS